MQTPLTQKFHRKFIATVAGLAIAITGLSAAPAAADKDDTARALTAILGIALLGAVIHDSRKDDHVTRHDGRRPVYVPDHRPIKPRPLPPRAHSRKLLPQACLRTFRTRSGHVNGFGQRCLTRNYRHAASLPGGCSIRVKTSHGVSKAYNARCLRARGYKIARR